MADAKHGTHLGREVVDDDAGEPDEPEGVPSEIQVGDVVLDLCQGRPMQVIGDPQQTAAEWSGDNGYDLLDNYGNSRLGADPNDRVFECVYVGSIKSEPSRDYTFPESRLARVEVESADDGRPVADRVRVETLEALFTMATSLDGDWSIEPESWSDAVAKLVTSAGSIDDDLVDEARELAEVDAVVGGDDDAA